MNEPIVTEGQALAVPPPAPNPLALLQSAIERGVSPDHLDKLLTLQERYEANEAAKAFAEALAGFQAACPPVRKSKDAQTGKYAPYEAIMGEIAPLLKRFRISVSFSQLLAERTDPRGEVVTYFRMTCRLQVGTHFQDKTVEAPMPDLKQMVATMKRISEPQAFGIMDSYFKRYALILALNIVTVGEDHDGALGLSAAETSRVWGLILDCERAGRPADLPRLLNWLGAPAVEKVPRARFDEAVKALTAKLNSKPEGVAK